MFDFLALACQIRGVSMSSSTSSRASELLRAANGGALVVPLRDRSAVLVSGKDRSSWLNGLVTCDIAKLGEGDGAYGLLVEKKGRIQADFYVAKSETALALAVVRELRAKVIETLDHYLIMEDAELAPAELAFFLVQGPKALDVAKSASHLATHRGSLDLLGRGGAIVAGTDGDALARALAEGGGTLADEAGWEAVRIEQGLPRFGVEVDTSLYPQEAALEKLAVSFSKGCYLGQEVVYMLENRGHVKRKLVPLDIEGASPLAKGDPVTTPAGEVVGDVKSAVASPSDPSRTAAIAMVKYAQAKPGTELVVGGRAARVRG
jgi:hypothetical protein